MPKVRSGGSGRWVERAAVSTDTYKQGVQNPRRDWETATKGAVDSYEAGVRKAISDGRFSKGVSKTGNSGWSQGALTKGADRYAGGVAAAEGKYASNVQPFYDVIEATTLPARGPKGDPKNLERVRVLNMALHKKKLSL